MPTDAEGAAETVAAKVHRTVTTIEMARCIVSSVERRAGRPMARCVAPIDLILKDELPRVKHFIIS